KYSTVIMLDGKLEKIEWCKHDSRSFNNNNLYRHITSRLRVLANQHIGINGNTLHISDIQEFERSIHHHKDKQYNMHSISKSSRQSIIKQPKQTSRRNLKTLSLSKSQINLGKYKKLNKPTLNNAAQDFLQSDQGLSNYNSSSILLDNSFMVSSTAGPSNRSTDSVARQMPLYTQEDKEILAKKDLLPEAIILVKKTTQRSSNITIGSAFKKWNIWCKETFVNPIQCFIKNIANFLVKICDK
ncbi:14842_t:CDS:2, partial [Cetraspora pellucida]